MTRYQVLAGGQDSGLAGAAYSDPDEAYAAARKLKRHPDYKNSSITIHDRHAGTLFHIDTKRTTQIGVRAAESFTVPKTHDDMARIQTGRLNILKSLPDREILRKFSPKFGPHVGSLPHARAEHAREISTLENSISGHKLMAGLPLQKESTLNKIRRVLNLGESNTRSHKEMADHYDKVAHNLSTMSARFVYDKYGPKGATAHQNHIKLMKANAAKHRAAAAELGESTEEKPKYKRRYHVTVTNPQSRLPFPDFTTPADTEEEAHTIARSCKKNYAGCDIHVHDKETGTKKLIEAKEEDEPKSSSTFPKAHHWNNAKRAYGVPLNVPLKSIGGYAIDRDGNRVSKQTLVKRHAFAAANAASKFTPEQKRAWVADKIAKAVAAKKARENVKESFWKKTPMGRESLGDPTRDQIMAAADDGWAHGASMKKKNYIKLRNDPVELETRVPMHMDHPHLVRAWQHGFKKAGKEEHGL